MKNILLYPGERFVVKTHIQGGDFYSYPNTQFRMNFRQLNESNNRIYGNIAYQITTGSVGLPAMPMMQAADTDERGLYKLYPNPAEEKVTVEYVGKDQEVNIMIYDITGRTVFKKERVTLGYAPYDISLRNLSPGIYIVNVLEKQGKTHSFKVMKQ